MRRTLASLFGAIVAVVAASGAWAAGPSRNLDDYVVLGLERVHLKDLATIRSGNVGVNEPAGIALVIGRGSVFAAGTSVVGDSARGDRITLFDLYTNRLLTPVTALTINGVGPEPTGALPLIDPLPTLPVFASSSGTFVAAGNLTLPPGVYGNVVVQAGVQLTLTAGTYEMRALQTGRNARIVATGPVTINIKGTLRMGNGAFIGADSSLTAQDVIVNLGGTVGRFGAGCTATLTLFGPNARLAFGRNFVGIGQFVGRSINTDHSTNFSRGECGNGVVETHEQCDPPDGIACDAQCQLVVPTTTTTAVTTSTTSSTTTTSTTTTSTTSVTSTSTSSTAPTTSTSSSTSTSTSSTAPTTSTSSSTSSTEPPTTTTSSATSTSTSTTSTSTSTTSTLATSTSSSTVPEPTTTTTTMPVAICGNNELEFPEECDPPGSACPPDGLCNDQCVCIFGGSS